MIDMSELMVDADFIQPTKIPILRGVGDWNGHGLYDPSEIGSFNVTIIIQQSPPDLLEALAEGERNNDYIKWWQHPKMIMADGISVRLSDVIIWHEKYYRVIELHDRSDNGFYNGRAQWAPHLAGLSELLPPVEPPIGLLYSISGTVSRMVRIPRIAGVKIALQGTMTAVTFTDINGDYSFENLPAGMYVITPEMEGYDFNPRNIVLTIP